jgi:hypothetical protein
MSRRQKTHGNGQTRMSDDDLNGIDVALTTTDAGKPDAVASHNRVIHITTKVQCLFGVLDETGDVIQRIPFEVDVSKLTPQAFAEVYGLLHARRAELADQLAKGG